MPSDLLGLHRFSSDDDWERRRRKNGIDPLSPAGINGLIVREIRKRLWAAMSTDDWFGAVRAASPPCWTADLINYFVGVPKALCDHPDALYHPSPRQLPRL